jgi:hypothetical protein
MIALLTERGRELIEARVNADSVWCFPCGLAGRGLVVPVTQYAVAHAEAEVTEYVSACRTCYAQAQKDGINIVSVTPIEQPAHVEFLRNLLRGEVFPGIFAPIPDPETT